MVRFRIAAVLALAFIAGCSKDPEVAKREYASSGDAYVAQEKYAEAVVEYRNAVQQDPKFGEARYKLAETYVKLNMPGEAYREYIRAADLMPDNAEAQLKASGILLFAGKFLDAQTRAEKVLARNPKSVDAQLLRAAALAEMKQLNEAVTQVESAILEDPQRAGTYLGLGIIESRRGNQDAAETAFKRAAETDPKSITAKLALANFYWLSRRVDEAETTLKEAEAVEPKNIQLNRALAAFYLGSGRAPQAEQYLKNIVELSNDDASRFGLANYYLVMKREPEARAIFEAVGQGSGATAAIAKVRLAGIAVAQNRRADAYKLLEEALQKLPNSVAALVAKAELLLEDKKTDEALAAAKLADIGSARVHLALGRIHTARRDFPEAVAAYNEALRLEPRLVRAQLELARVHIAEGKPDAAAQAARAVIKVDPGNGEAQLLLARSLISTGDVEGAEVPMAMLVKGAPESATVHAHLGSLRMTQKDVAGARAAFERALELDPNEIDALTGLASLDLQAGRPERARDRIEKRMAASPKDGNLLVLAARTYAASKDFSAAERTLRQAIAVDQSNLAAYALLGQLFSSQRRLDEARAEFEELAKRMPKSVGPPTLVGMMLQMQNNTQQAKIWYERALNIDSKAAVAANNLAWLYSETGGNLDVALQLAQTAKAQLPNVSEVDDTLGWIYYKKGLATLAITAFQESVTKNPKNATYHYHLGLAYLKNGDKEKARQSLEQALALNPAFDGSGEAQKALASLRG